MPDSKIIIKCGDCAHSINSHNHDGCDVVVPGPAPICACLWTPNDVALHLVFGELTAAYALRELRRRG